LNLFENIVGSGFLVHSED